MLSPTRTTFPHADISPVYSSHIVPYIPNTSNAVEATKQASVSTVIPPSVPSLSSISVIKSPPASSHASPSPSPPSPLPGLNTPTSYPIEPPKSSPSAAIGLVLANKTFSCLQPTCSSSRTFGRLADLYRHINQQHTPGLREHFYCRQIGCPRSIDGPRAANTVIPSTLTLAVKDGVSSGRVQKRAGTTILAKDRGRGMGVGRGWSFGTRKDKRGEHERSVHGILNEDFWKAEKKEGRNEKKRAGRKRAHEAQ
ncbi:hypothetical protein DM02DRAFT_313895 [Periconia macrospinosa]|uniref:C2H2-type domain-containing protein n=1 Tax=Periconia macrospinosa TaxID=97972 RepID=A0A2V1DVR8_9PLEO|nr:hypothetical protein DM02DRAFT_313895 [Periconia macrospinosa]